MYVHRARVRAALGNAQGAGSAEEVLSAARRARLGLSRGEWAALAAALRAEEAAGGNGSKGTDLTRVSPSFERRVDECALGAAEREGVRAAAAALLHCAAGRFGGPALAFEVYERGGALGPGGVGDMLADAARRGKGDAPAPADARTAGALLALMGGSAAHGATRAQFSEFLAVALPGGRAARDADGAADAARARKLLRWRRMQNSRAGRAVPAPAPSELRAALAAAQHARALSADRCAAAALQRLAGVTRTVPAPCPPAPAPVPRPRSPKPA